MSRHDIPAHWTPVQAAAWQTVHEYVDKSTGQRGAAALGPKLGKSAASLSNEVNPEIVSHKHGLEDAITEQLLTNDFRLLKAFASELHHVAIPLPDLTPASDVELLNQFAAWQAKMGETCQEIHKSLEDGDVTPLEYQQVRAKGFAHITEFFRFLQRMRQLSEVSDG